MEKPNVSSVLALLRPEDLWPAWRVVDLQEQLGLITAAEARAWKDGIYEQLELSGLTPEDILR